MYKILFYYNFQDTINSIKHVTSPQAKAKIQTILTGTFTHDAKNIAVFSQPSRGMRPRGLHITSPRAQIGINNMIYGRITFFESFRWETPHRRLLDALVLVQIHRCAAHHGSSASKRSSSSSFRAVNPPAPQVQVVNPPAAQVQAVNPPVNPPAAQVQVVNPPAAPVQAVNPPAAPPVQAVNPPAAQVQAVNPPVNPPAAQVQAVNPPAAPVQAVNPPNGNAELNALLETVKALQSTVAADGVTRALYDVRQLASRPAPLVDTIALLAALEHLADSARDGNQKDRAKYDAIFKQCRPLANNPRLPAVVVRLLGDEEQKQVAAQIQKILRGSPCPSEPDHTLNGRYWALGVKGRPSLRRTRIPSRAWPRESLYERQIPRKRQKTLHFCPERDVSNHVYIRWCDWRGLTLTRNATPTPSLESVSELHAKASAADVAFRDPDYFVAGEIHNHRPQWEIILTDYPKRDEILGYLRTGVRVQDFLVPFKGDFQGQFYDTKTPPRASFPNSKSCTGFEDFISTTLSQRLRNGSMSLWGKVGSVEPPHLVMPITIEPTKPRMCHDERFLNLWIKDCPLALDYISNLPRYVGAGSFQTTMDEKSGQYIDDRHFGQLVPAQGSGVGWSNMELAEAAIFLAASVLSSLGYFIGLAKSHLSPSQSVRFLGFIVDSVRRSFILPEDKKQKFSTLRETILKRKTVSIKTLQRLAGKITSFCLAVPAAQLYCREIYRAIPGFQKSCREVKLQAALRDEITHWRFLDTWQECLPWPGEKHLVVRVCSDASNFAWGGVIEVPSQESLKVRDYWSSGIKTSPIVVKEATALVHVLRAGKHLVANSRVDAHTDNLAFLQSWKKQGGKNQELNDVLKQLHSLLLESNISLNLCYVPSRQNPADAPSRTLSDKDCKLSPAAWLRVEQLFGPHTIDLMALDSNTQLDVNGNPLKHFSPWFTPLSAGVNVFAQVIDGLENAYVFPPFVLVAPLLRFLQESEARFTIVVPRRSDYRLIITGRSTNHSARNSIFTV
ncbi:hypothetical protein QZH41_003056 [Actinostola sp. cb2023]|nr:hypothetical protein QZH41_003056 [Actinostola sp. cb2023]